MYVTQCLCYLILLQCSFSVYAGIYEFVANFPKKFVEGLKDTWHTLEDNTRGGFIGPKKLARINDWKEVSVKKLFPRLTTSKSNHVPVRIPYLKQRQRSFSHSMGKRFTTPVNVFKMAAKDKPQKPNVFTIKPPHYSLEAPHIENVPFVDHKSGVINKFEKFRVYFNDTTRFLPCIKQQALHRTEILSRGQRNSPKKETFVNFIKHESKILPDDLNMFDGSELTVTDNSLRTEIQYILY